MFADAAVYRQVTGLLASVVEALEGARKQGW